MFDLAGNLIALKRLSNDIEYGKKREPPVIKRLEGFFKETITQAQDQFSSFDASSTTTKYEIKTRRNRYSQYPTTMIGVNKIREYDISLGRLVFVFHFTDGLYYIEYTPIAFEKYDIQNVRAVRGRGLTTETPHFFIPIEDLIHIDI